ncbi:MAG TPA: DNA replication/repair protein RecF [Gammaproteobacteria bacterium]|nr:DNA replication/repair protein RecF [Gammaproteobacteria bacterium]
MRLERLAIQRFRNLEPLDILLHPGINLFHGPNASGKTSLLEAVHLLSCGKSFRSNSLKCAVQEGQSDFTLFARLREGEQAISLGLALSGRRLQLRADGRPLHRRSQLAAIMPVITLHQESPRLISEGPRWRRRFLDWGLFHVEPLFHRQWQRYMRALKQRNRALLQRAGDADVKAWHGEMTEAGEAIHGMRVRFVKELEGVFQEYLDQLIPDLKCLSLGYEAGWNAEEGLEESLCRGMGQDRILGYTRLGPHRADLVMTVEGVAARERVSRGQQKLLVSALFLAQAAVYRRRCERRCVLLVDDVAAELDHDHRERFLELLKALDIQVLLTATEALDEAGKDLIQKRFHVEHGRIHGAS